MNDALTAAERGWLKLSLLPGVGARLAERLTQFYGSAAAAAEAPLSEIAGIVGERALSADAAASERVLERCEKLSVRIVTRESEGYPALLAEIYDPPPVLYVRGEADLRQQRTLAVVGSRTCSAYGKETTATLCENAAHAGVCIVSGMARGIDTCAHIGALHGEGTTLAVLGCGVDIAYPPENDRLRDRILEGGGAVLSEYPPGTQPAAGHFPQRNRIISGLSHGVMVVEGARTSGAMITVNCALDQGREVLAVPGNINSPTSTHPNRLIREGAAMITCVQDIFEVFSWVSPLRYRPETPEAPALDADEQTVYACLVSGPRPFSALCSETGFAVSKLNSLLTTLELRRIIRQLPGRMIAIAGPEYES